ncbi:MAG TPA: hypothetical protein QF480_09085 [Bacteroidales bacterium]|jgi:hypothetical protein|nr:hypothetical protein [Bacteroidales bacterium]|tara:strand:- start:139 stop:438 length:300 start_codon:yes stop_codon:yes gene_type:complete
MLDRDVIPVIIKGGNRSNKKTIPEDFELSTHKQFIIKTFEDGNPKTSAELITDIKKEYNVGESVAKKFKQYFLNTKLIKDKGGGHKRQYVLNSSNQFFV